MFGRGTSKRDAVRFYNCVTVDATGAALLATVAAKHLGEAAALATKRGGQLAAAAPVEAEFIDEAAKAAAGAPQPIEASSATSSTSADRTLPWCFPRGLVQRWTGAALAPAQQGYWVHANPELTVVEAAMSKISVHQLWLALVEQLPSADNVEVRLLPEFGNTNQTEVWLTPRIDIKKIIRFLDDHQADISDNGLIEASVYVRHLRGTLKLTSHKTLLWVGQHKNPDQVTAWFSNVGLTTLAQWRNPADIDHLHYRSAASSDRTRMTRRLKSMRLRLVDTLALAS
jgi:hypothetical protein